MLNLILVRGASGSGKTTFVGLMQFMASAKGIEPDFIENFCADHYFYDQKGNYNFDPSKLGMAHQKCQIKTETAMLAAIPFIFVDNTFTKKWEMQPYFDLAEKHDYKITTIVVENRHESCSIHNVPEIALTRQKERFEIKL